MAADIVFLVFVVYGLVFGLRRGFYKELIAFTALVIAIGAARTWRDPAGRLIQSKLTFVGPGTGHVLGAIAIWIVAFFLVNLIGRLVLKKLRDPDRENALEKAADGVADAAEGGEKPGPVTLLTNPVAKAHKSVVYWSDKLLGGLLGVVKGAAAAYAIFAVVYFVDLHLWDLGKVKEQIANSHAGLLYSEHLALILRNFPEYRVIENAATTERLVDATNGDPKLIDRLAVLPNWDQLKATQAFKDLSADPEMQAAWTKLTDGKRDLRSLLRSRKVRRLLSDERFHELFAEADVEGVIHAIANPPPPPPPPK